MAKQYKTWELIKAWQEGETGKFKANEFDYIVNLDEVSITFENGKEYFVSSSDKRLTWTKVQTQVTFLEAINSGKRIKPVNSILGYMGFESLIAVLNNSVSTRRGIELINGKWLIEDGE